MLNIHESPQQKSDQIYFCTGIPYHDTTAYVYTYRFDSFFRYNPYLFDRNICNFLEDFNKFLHSDKVPSLRIDQYL